MTDEKFIDEFLKKFIYDPNDDRWIREELLPQIIDTVRKSCADVYDNTIIDLIEHRDEKAIMDILNQSKEDDFIYNAILTAPIQEGV